MRCLHHFQRGIDPHVSTNGVGGEKNNFATPSLVLVLPLLTIRDKNVSLVQSNYNRNRDKILY